MTKVIPSRDLPRIYADFHGTVVSRRDSSRVAVMLVALGSLRDLSNAGIRLTERDRLLIFADSDEAEDLECEAEAYFDPESKVWMAELLEKIRYVPRRATDDPSTFLCVCCRKAFEVGKFGRPETSACAGCGTSVDAAIAPPK